MFNVFRRNIKDMKTKLQKQFEEQTPTIKGVKGNEYNLTYCAWLELQVEKAQEILLKITDDDINKAADNYVKDCQPLPLGSDAGVKQDFKEGAKWLKDYCVSFND